jgi:hypothetical protein
MTILSISAAAQTAGIDRRTLQRAIKAGRVSATVDATGRRGVDVAELLRVYGPLPGTPQASTQGQRAALPQATPGAGAADALVDVLRDQVRQMQEQLRLAQEREARLLTMLEHEQTTRASLEVKLLAGPKGRKKKRD